VHLLAILLAVVPLTSAWHLQFYKDEQYRNIIEDRSGTLGQPYKNLAQGNKVSYGRDRLSKWKISDISICLMHALGCGWNSLEQV
jgi:hypothetical protein